MEISSIRSSSSISSLIKHQSPAICSHCFYFRPNRRLSFCAVFGKKGVGLNRFGLVLNHLVRSKEDDDGDLQFDPEEENVFWNPLNYIEDLKLKMDSEKSYKAIVYGSAALGTLLVTSSITSALDKIPLVPKLMEVVGLGYTVWFSFRYLVFKENRDELFAKIDELKKQIL